MANILYQKLERQYSIDNGNTWITMDAYKVGDILENPSDCGGESSGSTCVTSTTYSYGDYVLTPSSSIVEYNVIPTVMVSRNYTATTTNSDCSTTIETANEIIKQDVSPTSTNPSGENPNATDRTVTATTEYGTYTFIQQGNPNVDSGGTDNPNTSGGTSDSGNTESSGSTTECTDTLSFAWSGSSSSQKFKINGNTYTAKTNPYVTTLSDLNVSSFTSSQWMFSGCTNITAITSIPCTNNVTDMYQMFYDCRKLTSLDLTYFDTSNVTKMTYMFYKCSGLTSLDLSSFDTSNVNYMDYMFNNCTSLTSITFGDKWDTSKVTNMSYMFERCSGLTSLDLSSFDTSKVSGLDSMFNNCTSLESLNLSGWDLSIMYTNTNNMFYNCYNLTTITMNGCNCTTINKIKSMLPNVTIITDNNCTE